MINGIVPLLLPLALDRMDGALFCTAYFKDREFTKQDILNYLRNPFRVRKQYSIDCVYFLPMGENASPEPDWSGNGNNGTVNGTAYGIVSNPPVAPWAPFGEGWFGQAQAAAVGGTIPLIMHHRKMTGVS